MLSMLVVIALCTAVAEPDVDVPVVREEILVTAERGEKEQRRIPAAVSVILRQDLEAMPVDDLGAVLNRLPGITVLLEGAGSRPMVTARGFFGGGEVEYVQLLIDGVPAGDAESGLAPWQSIPTEAIDRVELVRGPASAVYGDTALAGVIQVFTRPAEDLSSTHVSLELGSFDSREATVTWRRMDSVDINLSAAASSTSGFREHSATDRYSLNVSAGMERLGGRFDLRLFGSSIDAEEPGLLPLDILDRTPSRSLELFRFDQDSTGRLSASVHYTKEGTVPFEVGLWTNGRDSTLVRTILLAPGFGNRAERETSTRSFGTYAIADFAGSIAARSNELKMGIEAGRDSIDTQYFAVDEEGQRGVRAAADEASRRRIGLFLTDQFELSEWATLTAGLRYDSIRDSASAVTTHKAWSPRAGINLRAGSHVLFFQVARAFKAPTLDQLFDRRPYPDFTGGSFTISNPDLRPQRAINFEAGVRSTAHPLRWEFLTYQMEVEDEIDFDVATFSYRNIGESLHRGIEAAAGWRLRRIEPRFSYAWTQVQPLTGEHRERQLKNIPEHIVQMGARVDLPGSLQLDASLRLLSGWFLDNANTLPMEDGWRLDFRLRRQFGAWVGRVDVLNALNEVVPHVGVVLQDFSGGEVPYAYPSASRSVRVGIERRF